MQSFHGRNRVLESLWNDDEGFIITMELILIATIIGIGSIVGLTCVRDALNSELADFAEFLESVDWSNNSSESAGNTPDVSSNRGFADSSSSNNCIDFTAAPQNEA